MDTVDFQKVTTSAADITKSVVAAQAEVFDIYAKTSEGMPISALFSAAATMQRATLQNLDTLAVTLKDATAKPSVKKSGARSSAKATEASLKAATNAVKKAVNAQADALIGADASAIAATSKTKEAVTKAAASAAKGDLVAAYEDLTVVVGIGPSTMKKLQDEGIKSLNDLAKTSNKDLTAIIEKANVRMLKNTPADWIADAKRQIKTLKSA